ncbi:hypothetical protein J3R83DRAFT_5442 [Lanmaoa asiatica]|nr:hypothetical protein J3R83DRAFT_5442 [Lanmaoa asiatica]
MAKYSLPHIQFALTINPWRHIQTAWKRKFKCATEDILEMDREDDIEALQAGHTQATENRMYGLSTHSLAGAAEDVLPLFLQASIAWQKQCQVMPGGTGLPYFQARSHMIKKPDSLPKKPQATAMHKQAQDCAIDQEAMIENIATRVVEHLTPMLKEFTHGLMRTMRQTDSKGKQKVVSVDYDTDTEDFQEDHDI